MLPQDKIKRKRLVKSSKVTTSKFGNDPNERSIEELIKSGIVLIDKPSGPTSHQVSAWVKDILGIKKAGHGGTLDPRVTGLLPVTLGKATNAVRAVHIGGKEYVGIMLFHSDVTEEKVKEIFSEFTGKIYQMPPVRSAVKREMRVREIYYLELLEMQSRLALFKVGCESGTYIRTLCHDIGDAMGTGSHMQELRRTEVGSFTEDDSVTLHDLKDAYVYWKDDGKDEHLRKAILPLERLFGHLPKIVIKDSAVDAVCHGANLAIPGVLELDSGIEKGDMVALLTSKGEGVALGKALMNSETIFDLKEGIAAKTERVLMDPGIYPKLWHAK
jgi:H/ACA ribonucleoprotein complex subunit 4